MKNNTFDVDTMSFDFEGIAIQNPTCSPDGRFTVDLKGYGFYVEHTGGGCTCWVKKLENGYLVITDGDLSHELGECGNKFLMCFYDGDTEHYEEGEWGNRVACADLFVGVMPEDNYSEEGSVIDYVTLTKIINGVYDKCDIFIDRDQALALVDLFKKIDLANT
jgi:hypothetical protein